jgi:ATP-binding protein involved in chromosome partitioning
MSEQARERRRIGIRTYKEMDGADRSGLASQVGAQREQVAARLSSIRFVVGVMSGKGGVGKSFVTVGLATALARAGRAIGVLDGDLHGPTAARMLGASPGGLPVGEDGVDPAVAAGGVRVVSSDLLLDEAAPLRWRGPEGGKALWRGALEAGMLREFLAHVRWGTLDVLLVDLPPGTERLETLADLVPGLAGVVVVTIPSEASLRAVRRAIEAARSAGVPVLGIVENMAGYRCAGCETPRPLFPGNAGERLAREADAPLLGRLAFDPRARGVDGGDVEAATGALSRVAEGLIARLEGDA